MNTGKQFIGLLLVVLMASAIVASAQTGVPVNGGASPIKLCTTTPTPPYCNAARGDRTSGTYLASGRSEVISQHGMVSSSQALCSEAGIRILQIGGNAIDAAIATAACLNLMEPMNVGMGGDIYALIYIASQNMLYNLNSGDMAPGYATVAYYNSQGYSCNLAGAPGSSGGAGLPIVGAGPPATNWGYGCGMPSTGFLSAPVPGSAWGWVEAHDQFGQLPLITDLTPAIDYANNGFPVTEIIGNGWTLPKASGCKSTATGSESCASLDADSVAAWYINGAPPAVGQIFKNPDLANALTLLGKKGKKVMYSKEGEIAQAIVAKMNAAAESDGPQETGRWTIDDLASYRGQWDTPAHTYYTNAAGVTYDIYESMAPSQAWNTLEIMNILQECIPTWTGTTLAALGPTNPEYWYYFVEAKKLASVDLADYNSDPNYWTMPQWQTFQKIISHDYAKGLCGLVKPKAPFVPTPSFNCGAFSLTSPLIPYQCPTPLTMPNDEEDKTYTGLGDTIYLTTADRWGNMVSWVNSNYSTFGSGITIPPYGFVINDRAAQFTLNPYSPNAITPRHREYSTISAGFVMQNGVPLMTLGLMGGDMQPQGHAQILVNELEFGATPQAAGDMGRFYQNVVPNTLNLETQLFNLVGLGVQPNGQLNPAGNMTDWGYKVSGYPNGTGPTCSGSNCITSATGGTFGGYESIMFIQDPSLPVPTPGGPKATGIGYVPPVNGIYRSGTELRKDGAAIGW